MRKTRIILNKPIQIGQVILDISKMATNEFYYDYLLPKYGDNVRVMYMDINSFVLYIKTGDFYDDIADDVPTRFDSSNFTEDRPLPMDMNKKVPGLMNDEDGGKIIIAFVSPCSKVYVRIMLDGKEDMKCKGVTKSALRQHLNYEKYKNIVLNGNKEIKVNQTTFQYEKQKMYTYTDKNKVFL